MSESSHGHHNHQVKSITSISKAFIVSIVLNLLFVFIEFIAGLYTNSLSLLSDAGHNLSDVATLALSLLAFQISKKKATDKYTFGFHRGTILASLINAVILLIAVGCIAWESVQRFITPHPIDGKLVSIVAIVGILINAFSAFLFFKEKSNELNARGAFIHLMLDAIVSALVVIGGFLIYYTGYNWIDPLVSIIIMFAVIYSTWGLLKESFYLTLDAVPSSINIDKVKSEILTVSGIQSVYHIHVWALSTTRNALTAHVVFKNNVTLNEANLIKNEVKHKLEHLNIQHATLETEAAS
ncbi:MAG: cation transporter [Bacteroidetes bacterium]|nr:cation transporter [Bacteroidota bacterium]